MKPVAAPSGRYCAEGEGPAEDRFAPDSVLEGTGFELPVPREMDSVWISIGPGPRADSGKCLVWDMKRTVWWGHHRADQDSVRQTNSAHKSKDNFRFGYGPTSVMFYTLPC